MYQFINYKNMKCLDNWKLNGLIAVKFNIKSMKYHLSYPLYAVYTYILLKLRFRCIFIFYKIDLLDEQ